MKPSKLEICCGSADDVLEAAAAGAHRVELNCGLFLGGLTPSIGMLRVAREAGIEIMAMVRPREGGFCYTDAEFRSMLADARALLDAGADGIVFGFLHEDGAVDAERCRAMLEIIGDRQSVFHRAVDVVPDWRSALDTLAELGVTRVLTSGQEASALAGAGTIREMREHTAGRLEILPGGGIRPGNVREVLERTGCTQVHASVRRSCLDPSASGNPEIHFGGALYPSEDRYAVTDRAKVSALLERL